MDVTYHQPVNLGNPEECTILDAARLIGKAIGVETRISITNASIDDPRQRKPDHTRRIDLIGRTDFVNLELGIAKILMSL